MSNDLISRSAVYNKLLELEELARNRVLDTPTNSPCYQRYVAQLNERTALKHLIADEPTVYDAEKVVEQLEEEREYSYADFTEYVNNYSPCLDDEYDDYFHRGLERAIRLVKAGGNIDNH